MSKSSKPRARSKKSKSVPNVSGGSVLACIDMGTNSFHMIICRAKPDRDGFEVITRVKDAVPFFRKALINHYIDDYALASAMKILRGMVGQARIKGVDNIIAVATSAVRESRNGAEVLDYIRSELDLNARTISGKEEARLIYLGVLYSMPELKDKFAIVDIGGGSTEVIAADRSRCHYAESYKLGAARLTQRFFRKVSPSDESIKSLHDEVRGTLRPAAAAIDAAGGFSHLIGTSGTIQALAKLDRVLAGRTAEQLHGWVIPIDRLEEIVQYITSRTIDGVRLKGVSPDRAQTVLAGSVVLLETLRALNASEITVCTAALREGVVVNRFLQMGWLKVGMDDHIDPRSESVYKLIEKYDMDLAHAEHVAFLANQIFDQTKGVLHDYSDAERHILWSAGMLHDIGTFIGRKGHHKHSSYLIRHGGLLGHSEEEVGMIASVARYHRGAEPKDNHEAWFTLGEYSKPMVRDLAAMLRVAEALDRSHLQVIKSLKVVMSVLDKKGKGSKKTSVRTLSLIPTVKAGETCLAESWAFGEKKAFFEHCFDVKLDILLDASTALAHSTT